jgi:hypothetical protein
VQLFVQVRLLDETFPAARERLAVRLLILSWDERRGDAQERMLAARP